MTIDDVMEILAGILAITLVIALSMTLAIALACVCAFMIRETFGGG